MVSEETDVRSLIVDLQIFFVENPNTKLPLRYLVMLSRILYNQLSEHPATKNDTMQTVLHQNA